MNRSTDHPLSCTGRKLAYSSFHTYQQIPKNVDVQNLEEAVKLQVLHCSNSFREQLRVAAADISKVAESLAETADLSLGNQTSFEQDYDALFSIEKSWQICEIFCLNPTKLISIELIKWLKDLCFQVPLESYVAQFQAADEPESLMTSSSFSSGGTAMGYWDLVCQLVMQGNLVAAESMLSVHSEIASALAGEVDGRGMLRISDVVASSSNAITRVQCETLLDLLRSHPFAGLVTVNAAFAAGTSVPTNLVQEFTAWQNRVRKFRQSKVAILAVIPELDTVLRILLGDSSTLEHHSELPAGGEGGWGWAKQVIALLLYVYPPPLNKTDLSRVVEECMHKEADSGMSGNSLSHGYIATLREVMVGNIGPMLRSLYQMTLSASPYRSYLGVTPLLCTAHLCLLLVTGAGKEDLLIPLADGPNETSFFEEVFLEVAYRLHSLEFPVEVVLSYLTVCPMRGKEYARVLLPRSSMPSDRSVLTVATTMRESLDLPQEAAAVLIARGAWWSKRGNAAKAAYFYQEAADEARLAGLLEASLRRCMHAVVACHSAFPGLSLAPCGVTTTVQDRTETAQSSDTGMQELENALVEAEELLMTVDSDAAPAGGSILSLLRKSLGVYVQVIQDRFATSASSLRGAVQRLAALLIDTPSGPILPIRYWLHTLELVAWYTNCISGLESAGSIDATSTASAGDDMQVDDAVDMSSSTATPSSARRPVFRKDQAYALLARLKEVTTSYGATTQLIGTGSSDALQSLHLSLMGVLCRSAIKENTLLGAQKAGVGHVTNKVGYSKRFAFEGRGGRHVHGWQGLTGRGFDNTSAECSLQRAEVYEILTGSSVDYGSL